MEIALSDRFCERTVFYFQALMHKQARTLVSRGKKQMQQLTAWRQFPGCRKKEKSKQRHFRFEKSKLSLSELRRDVKLETQKELHFLGTLLPWRGAVQKAPENPQRIPSFGEDPICTWEITPKQTQLNNSRAHRVRGKSQCIPVRSLTRWV